MLVRCSITLEDGYMRTNELSYDSINLAGEFETPGLKLLEFRVDFSHLRSTLKTSSFIASIAASAAGLVIK